MILRKIREKCAKAWRWVKEKTKKIFTKSHAVQAVYFTSTLAFSAFVLNFFLPSWMAAMILGVLVVHEFAHFFTAVRSGRQTYLPFFIPWIYGVIGATRVKGHEPVSDQKIALAGPKMGAVVCAGAMATCAYLGFWPGFWVAAWMLASQIYSGTFGGDGRRYRRAKAHLTDPFLAYTAPAAA